MTAAVDSHSDQKVNNNSNSDIKNSINTETTNIATNSSVRPGHDANDSKSTKSNIKPGIGPDPNKPPARKAKDIRKERALLKKEKKSALNKDASLNVKNKSPPSPSLLDQ